MTSYIFKPEEEIKLPAESTAAMAYAYLRATEDNELPKAQALLSDTVLMTFPGGLKFTTLDQFVTWAVGCFNSVNKTFTRFDEVNHSDESVVYCKGTLRGEYSDGTPFSGVRFIDRFTVVNGKITDQQVWNDLGAD